MSDRNAIPLAPSAALTVETVTSVRHWNEHLFSFTITRPQSFRFRSGEFVMLGLPGEGRPLLRRPADLEASADPAGRPAVPRPQADRHARHRRTAPGQTAVLPLDRHRPRPVPQPRARSRRL